MNNSIPLVSVIIPVYRVEAFLPACLESIRKQTLRDFECILVDDGSPDSSGEICDRMVQSDTRFKVIHKGNGGLSDARNAGIASASGKYLCFIDSDDWVAEDMLKRLSDAAEAHDLEIVCCRILLVNQETGATSVRRELEPFCREDEVVFWKTCDTFAGLNNISACNKLFRREFLERNGLLFQKGIHYEDIVFWSRAFFLAKRISTVAEQLYFYRVARAGSTVHQKDFRDLSGSYRSKVEEAQKHGAIEMLRDDLIAYFVFRLLYCFASSRPEFRGDFYRGMRTLILSCGKYRYSSRDHFSVRLAVGFYVFLLFLPYPAFFCFASPFFLLSRFHLAGWFRRVFRLK